MSSSIPTIAYVYKTLYLETYVRVYTHIRHYWEWHYTPPYHSSTHQSQEEFECVDCFSFVSLIPCVSYSAPTHREESGFILEWEEWYLGLFAHNHSTASIYSITQLPSVTVAKQYFHFNYKCTQQKLNKWINKNTKGSYAL